MTEKITPLNIPEGEAKDFITENNLTSLLPEAFNKLNDAQKLKVIRDLERRIVDIVKSDAQTQYSEDLKQKKVIKKIRASLNKELGIKDFERKVFEKLKNSEEGKNLIKQDLEVLTKKAQTMDVFISKGGHPSYSFLENIGQTEKERETYIAFNTKANYFASIPYEWGQERGGKNKKEYEKAKIDYYKAKEEILKIKASREEKGEAMIKVLEADNVVQMEQLLNTHPEFEKVLDDFGKTTNGKEMVKDAGNFLNTVTGGKNWTNKLLFIGGYGARMGVSALSAASSMSLMGALGTATAGGVIGGLRGWVRGKETLSERQKQARHGQEDKSAEAKNTVSAENLNERMITMIRAFESASTPEEKAKKLDQIKRRIYYTQNKVEDGLVNFGDTKTALVNQYNLVNNLNNALVISASSEEKTKKEIDDRLDRFLAYKANEIGATQAKFIRKQALKGAVYGAGFATLGYGVRWLGEHVADWWGGHGTENIGTKAGTLSAHSTLAPHEMESAHTMGEIKTPEQILTAPSSEAIIHKGEGIEHTFRRQIEGDADLAKKLGFEGDIKDTNALHKFSGGAAHKLAIEKGYAGMAGHEVRITEADKVAYEIKLSGDKVIVNERGIDGKILHIDNDGKYPFGENPNNPYDKEFNAPAPEPVSHAEESAFRQKLIINKEIHPQHWAPADTQAHAEETLKKDIVEKMHEEAVKSQPRATGENRVYGTSNQTGYGTNYVYGTRSGSPYMYGNGPSGEHIQHFPGLSAEQNNLLDNHPEFADNPYDLPDDKLMQAYEASQKNISHIFPKDTDDVWGMVKDGRAKEMMATKDSETEEGLAPFISYLHKLKEASGLKPGGWLFHRGETNGEYVARALQKITSRGNLETFERSLEK